MKGSWVRSLVLFLPVAVAGLSLPACNSTPASPTTITSIAVTGSAPAIGSTSQFTATVTFSDNSTQDVTSTATWVSYNTAVATVSSTGVVTGVAAGTSVLEATYQSVAGTFGLTVTTGANISSVDLTTGAIPTIGSPAQFTCTATFSDGTTQDCTRTATWVSFNPLIATVSSTGLVTAHSTGTAVVKGTYQDSSGTYTFTVTH